MTRRKVVRAIMSPGNNIPSSLPIHPRSKKKAEAGWINVLGHRGGSQTTATILSHVSSSFESQLSANSMRQTSNMQRAVVIHCCNSSSDTRMTTTMAEHSSHSTQETREHWTKSCRGCEGLCHKRTIKTSSSSSFLNPGSSLVVKCPIACSFNGNSRRS